MRTIFHCDINNCFASIEMAVNPSLRGLAIAVCGDPAQRRGIVLAKSEAAKKCGVKTGDPLWIARQKCPQIRFVLPHFEVYEAYSVQIRKVYERYTPLVEAFGLDECWLDMTDAVEQKFELADKLANQIRQEISRLFNVTISVGVSFNKVFAKLASDLKKPDAVTHIDFAHFREKVWGLPVSSLWGVGRSTNCKLGRCGIITIGDLALSDRRYIHNLLGKNGDALWGYANGMDESPVNIEAVARQSLGHGTTLPADVYSSMELWPVIERLSDRVAFELQYEGFIGHGIQIYIRDNLLKFHEYQRELSFGIYASRMIADYSLMMLSQHYDWRHGIRAFGIRLYHLERMDAGRQLSLFEDHFQANRNRREGETDKLIRSIQARFGEKSITRGGRCE